MNRKKLSRLMVAGVGLIAFPVITVLAGDDLVPEDNLMERKAAEIAVKAAQGQGTENIARQSMEELIEFAFPSLFPSLPGWAERVEFEYEFTNKNKSSFTLRTVQPLYQTDDSKHTFFTQASVARLPQFGDMRTSSNLGFGYRHLFWDNTAMAGTNTFWDQDWNKNHTRWSLGGELKWHAFDLTGNYYNGVSDEKTVANTTERAMDGYDVELSSQIPYLPWARLHTRRYFWKARDAENVHGYVISGEFDLHQNMVLEVGGAHDNANDDRMFAQLRFRLGEHKNKPVMLSSKFIDDKPFHMRDMTKHTLERVRREDKIILQRRAGAVTISRGN